MMDSAGEDVWSARVTPLVRIRSGSNSKHSASCLAEYAVDVEQLSCRCRAIEGNGNKGEES